MSDSSFFSVAIGGHRFDDRESRALQEALAMVHRKSDSFCRCQQDNPIPLVVKKYGDDAHAFFGLARWPDTGLEHTQHCHFFGEDAQISENDVRPAFEDIGHGQSRAYLATSLRIIQRNIDAIAERKAHAASNPAKRMRASEASLLYKLWRTSGLNIYKGRQRSWFHATFALLRAAAQIVVNAEGETLDKYLLIGAVKSDKIAATHNQTVLEEAAKKYTRLFVIAKVRPYDRSKSRMMLSCHDYQGLPRMSVTLEQLDEAMPENSFVHQVALRQNGHAVVIACIEPSTKGWWSVLNISAIATSQSMVPVQSQAELAFEQYLTTNNRSFLKPIVLLDDGATTGKTAFILIDTKPRTYCQVADQLSGLDDSGKPPIGTIHANQNADSLSWSLHPSSPFPTLPDPAASTPNGNLQKPISV